MKTRCHRTRGFTIVEVMVAIVIMVLGILGLAGTAGTVSRLIGGGAQQTIAANIALARFERLRSSSCATIAGGSATTRSMTETWHASLTGSRLYQVIDTVTYTAAGGRVPAPLVFSSYVKC